MTFGGSLVQNARSGDVSYKSVPQLIVSDKGVLQECFTRVSYKNVQECACVSHKNAIRECPSHFGSSAKVYDVQAP